MKLLPIVEHAVKAPCGTAGCRAVRLHSTGMTCPMTCPKRCATVRAAVREDGHCEVEPEMRCVWLTAYDRAATLPLLPRSVAPRSSTTCARRSTTGCNESSWANLVTGRDRGCGPAGLVAAMSSRLRELCQLVANPADRHRRAADDRRRRPRRGAAPLAPLARYVDAVNATDNAAAHAHASNVAIAIALTRLDVEPVLQVVCRDKNRLALQADILGAACSAS